MKEYIQNRLKILKQKTKNVIIFPIEKRQNNMEKKHSKVHRMKVWPHVKCLTHKECHLDSFYPGKLYRRMKTGVHPDGSIKMIKE